MAQNDLDAYISLIDKGDLTEKDIPNNLRAAYRSRRNVEEGAALQNLLDSGDLTPEDLDDVDKARLQDLQFANRRIPEVSAEEFGAAVPELIRDGAIDLGQLTEGEPGKITQEIASRIPQSVLDVLGEIQPGLSVLGETTARTVGLPIKTPYQRQPTGLEHFVYGSLGFLPAFLTARGFVPGDIGQTIPAIGKLSPIGQELVRDAIANVLQQGLQTTSENVSGITDRNVFEQLQDIALGTGALLAFPAGAAVAGRGLEAIFRSPEIPIALRDVIRSTERKTSPLQESLTRLEEGLVGTPDEIPPFLMEKISKNADDLIRVIAEQHEIEIRPEAQGVGGIQQALENRTGASVGPRAPFVNTETPIGMTEGPPMEFVKTARRASRAKPGAKPSPKTKPTTTPQRTPTEIVEEGKSLNRALGRLNEQIRLTQDRASVETLLEDRRLIANRIQELRNEYRATTQKTPPASIEATRIAKPEAKATQGRVKGEKPAARPAPEEPPPVGELAEPPREEVIGMDEVPPKDYIEAAEAKLPKSRKTATTEAAPEAPSVEQLRQNIKRLTQMAREATGEARGEILNTRASMIAQLKTAREVLARSKKAAPTETKPKPVVDTGKAAKIVDKSATESAKEIFVATQDSVADINNKVRKNRAKIAKEQAKAKEATKEPLPEIAPEKAEVKIPRRHRNTVSEAAADKLALAEISEETGVPVGTKDTTKVVSPERVERLKKLSAEELAAGRTKKGRLVEFEVSRGVSDPAYNARFNSAQVKAARRELRKRYSAADPKLTPQQIKQKIQQGEARLGLETHRGERGTVKALERKKALVEHYVEKSAVLTDEQKDIFRDYAKRLDEEIATGKALETAATKEGRPTQRAYDVNRDALEADNIIRGSKKPPFKALQESDAPPLVKELGILRNDNAKAPKKVEVFMQEYSNAAAAAEVAGVDPEVFLRGAIKLSAKKHKLNMRGFELMRESAGRKFDNPEAVRKADWEEIKSDFEEARGSIEKPETVFAEGTQMSARGLKKDSQKAHDGLKEKIQKFIEDERGAVGDIPKPPKQPRPYERDYTDQIAEGDIRSANEKIEKALTASQQTSTALKQALRGTTDFLKRQRDAYLYWEPMIRNDKASIADWRRFLGSSLDANLVARDTVYNILSPLDLDKAPNKSYEIFRRLITLKSAQHDIAKSRKTPFHQMDGEIDVTAEEVAKEIVRLEKLASPNVKEAIEFHRQTIGLWWKSHIYERGLHPSETSPNPYYVPSMVLDYHMPYKNILPWIPQRATKPFRFYLKEKMGSIRDIDTDYANVMGRLFQQMELDLQVERFARRVAERNAISGEAIIRAFVNSTGADIDTAIEQYNAFGVAGLTRQTGRKFTDPETGAVYQIFRYDRNGFRKFRDTQGIEYDALDAATYGDPTTAFEAGKGDFIAALPEHIAMRLEKLREPYAYEGILQELRHSTAWWKQFTIGYAMLPFQFQNLLGDITAAYYLQDPGAIRFLPRALRALMVQRGLGESRLLRWMEFGLRPFGAGLNKPGAIRQAKEDLRLFHKERLIDAASMIEYEFASKDTRLDRMLKGHQPLMQRSVAGLTMEDIIRGNPWGFPHTLNELREGGIRGSLLLSYIKKVDDYKAGKGGRPKGKLVDIDGIPIEDIPGHVARNAVIDYLAVPERYAKDIRGLLFPFATYYAKSTINIGRYFKQNPGEASLKIGVPYALMHIWNNTQFPEQEDSLPPWIRLQPHVNIIGRDGKVGTINFGLPWTTFLEATGIPTLVDATIAHIKKGSPFLQAAPDIVGSWITAIPEGMYRLGQQLINPMIGGIAELIANKSWSGKTIVTDDEEKAGKGFMKRAAYIADRMFLPVNQVNRMANVFPDEPGVFEIGDTLVRVPRALSPLAAVGYKEFDVEQGRAINQRLYQRKIVERERAANKLRLLDAYLQDELEGTTKHFDDEIKKIVNEGTVIPSQESLDRSISSPRYQLKLAEEKFKRARGEAIPGAKAEYEAAKRIYQQYVDSLAPNEIEAEMSFRKTVRGR